MKKIKPETNDENRVKKDREDSSNATLGLMMGGLLSVIGFIILFIRPQMGILMISLAIFPLCEMCRGVISIRLRKITNDPLYLQNEEHKKQAEDYSRKLKLISKIKIIDFLVIILLIIVIIMTN